MSSGGSWLDRIVGGCVSLLIAAFAIYCAARLIESVLPLLIIVVGGAALIGLVVCIVVVINTWRNRW